MKRILLLGSTGSIGQNVLDVVERHADRFTVVGLGAHSSVDLVYAQAKRHPGARVALADPSACARLGAMPGMKARMTAPGSDAMTALVEETAADLVVNAVVGFAGLRPTMAALEGGRNVAIANKETIVTGGEIVMEAARKSGARIIPVDSEHAAIAQCLRGERVEDVSRVTLTASGGALRERDVRTLGSVTVADALAHPTWNMGSKVTIDSATLVNKGLEVIEAHWLFALPYDRISVVIHPQSIVHSLVTFVDGSTLAQLAPPDMRVPILFALACPERVSWPQGAESLAFSDLTFAPVDPQRYPCFDRVLGAARAGGNAPTILNAANEVAVAAFLDGAIPFARICELLDAALSAVPQAAVRSLDDIIDTDARTRQWLGQHFAVGARGGQPNGHSC